MLPITSYMQPKMRQSPRKKILPLEVDRISFVRDQSTLCHQAHLVEVSDRGLKILFERRFVSEKQRNQLNWKTLENELVFIHLTLMDLLIQGRITRVKYLKNGRFELGIDYSDSDPDYWRACLFELLPDHKSSQ
ncbi:MAG: hypothetical protein NZ480_08370 [Bdellovibrionaceae bacterium]|nr:hypothetical protein [Pseudobdellovibrionaceae bacterium]MDW8190352.1 hypothetical protein [Pseudobdellovibrionaceae bacterium]